MQDLYKELIQLLEQDQALIIDDKLNKALIIDRALRLDASFIRLLLKHPNIKKQFFVDIDSVLVFDKVAFQRFVNAKKFLPDSYTQYKNTIGLSTDNDHYITDSREVVLVWPHKDCVLEGGQTKEDAKRNEIFYNTTLAPDEIDVLTAPKVLTNWKRYDKDGETIPTKISKADNLIIKGNNLLALHTLKEKFRGQVKLIYIDPPFNTGNDSFGYNDSFNHSTWLTFMKNRLEVAKELLKNDGFIFIHCDYNEDAYLKILMDEIFGKNLYISTITVKSNSISGNKTQHKDKTILKNKDSIIVFKKNIQIKINPQYSEKNDWDTHYNSILINDLEGNFQIKNLKDELINEGIIDKKYTIHSNSLNESKFYEFIFNNRNKIFRGVNSIPKELEILSLNNIDKVVYIENGEDKMFAYNGNRLSFLSKVFKIIDGKEKMAQLLGDLWVDIDFQNTQNEGGGVSFTNGKKPEALIRRIIDMATAEGDIVLDYHLGSGTTAAVANKMRRKYIGIEQMDYIENVSLKRLRKVIDGEQGGISKSVNWKGGGSFIYAELMQSNEQYINQIQTATTTELLLKIWDELQATAFLSYKVLPENINTEIKDFKVLSIEEQQRFLVEILDKNLLYVNKSEINDARYKVSDADKEMNKNFYTM